MSIRSTKYLEYQLTQLRKHKHVVIYDIFSPTFHAMLERMGIPHTKEPYNSFRSEVKRCDIVTEWEYYI
jgi:hypothetical protein